MDLNRLLNGLTQSGAIPGVAGGLAGGALVGALSSKKGRKLAGTALKWGGIAALGGLAWKAYQTYQQQGTAGPAPATGTDAVPTDLRPQAFEAPLGPDNGSDGLTLLRAMISAAMADGHLSAAEQKQIFHRLRELQLPPEERALLFDEMSAPRSVQALAADARDPALAIEVYLASRLVIDERCPAGQQHLQELRQALRLPLALADSLEQQARQVLGQEPQAAA
jgi:uncharacterized membrane protein YebE (DUF533 family)